MQAEELPSAVQRVDDVELPSFRAPVIYVHARIPPCDTLGHKADTWNVAKPDFTCSMFCCTKGDEFIIRLLTEDNEKFAESFWRPDRPMSSVIDAAADSSRYFALRVENPETGAHHFLGIGFAERESAGQFKLTLSEHGKYIQRMSKAQAEVLEPPAAPDGASDASTSSATPEQGDSGGGPARQPQRDLSLKGSIRVSLPNQGEKRGLMAKLSEKLDGPLLQVGGAHGGLLRPPPRRAQVQQSADSAAGTSGHRHSAAGRPAADAPAGVSGELQDGAVAEGDFGDFCGAN
eukprot:jgi/Ulvmu1/179/UM001_0183.1